MQLHLWLMLVRQIIAIAARGDIARFLKTPHVVCDFLGIEAIRKLERAEANLIRVREQLDSTERRLRIVKGQAAKARLTSYVKSTWPGVSMRFNRYSSPPLV